MVFGTQKFITIQELVLIFKKVFEWMCSNSSICQSPTTNLSFVNDIGNSAFIFVICIICLFSTNWPTIYHT